MKMYSEYHSFKKDIAKEKKNGFYTILKELVSTHIESQIFYKSGIFHHLDIK